MKYLVVKGWLGFGDRLETLIMCVRFALDNKLIIHVDWTDSIWSHGNENFYTYFDLVNIPNIKSIDEIPADASVYPPFWKDKLKQPITQEIIDKGIEYNILTNFLSEKNKYTEDVVVYSCIGSRNLYLDPTFFANVFRLKDQRVLFNINERIKNHNLPRSIGVHIRGTDRIKSLHKRELSIQYLAVSAVMNGSLSGKQMVAVGDDSESFSIWKRFYPDIKVLSKLSLDNTNKKGNHNASKDELKVSKDEMNVDLLIDFFTLAACERLLTTFSDSRFAREARHLHPFVQRILGNE